MRVLPCPNADIQRQLWRLLDEAGLCSDASIGARDPRLQHCILLPGPGLLVTATRAHSPILEANCAELARLANLDVLLLRFVPQSDSGLTTERASACLIRHDWSGHIVAREGYRPSVPPQGSILLRHHVLDMPNYYVSHTGTMTACRCCWPRQAPA